MAFIAGEGVAPKGERYDRSSLVSDTENKLYKRTEKGDFIYSSNNLETGSIGINNYGKASISPVYSIFKPTERADSNFLGRRLVRKDFINQMVRWRQGVIYGQWRIHESDFLKIDINVPSVDEQIEIGRFLQILDYLFRKYQSKYEKLQNLKNAMLEKMFPKDGADVPETRLKGFADTWEQHELGEIVDVYSGKDYKHLAEGDIPVYGTGGYMLSVNLALSYEKDGIGIGRKGTIDKPFLLKAPFWTVDTLFYAIPREENDLSFVFAIIQNVDWKKKDESTGVPSLSKTAINGVSVMTPKYSEQIIIGACFAQIDQQLELHLRELDKLKNIRNSMLERMFV